MSDLILFRCSRCGLEEDPALGSRCPSEACGGSALVRPDVYHAEQAEKLARWAREARKEALQLRERASALESAASRDAAEARVHRIAARSEEKRIAFGEEVRDV